MNVQTLKEERAKVKQRIGRALLEARKQQGLTQRGLAEQLGITHAMVGRVERGEGLVRLDTLRALAHHLECDEIRLATYDLVASLPARVALAEAEKRIERGESTLADELIFHRRLRAETQVQIGERWGVCPTFISRMERGSIPVDADVIAALEAGLGKSLTGALRRSRRARWRTEIGRIERRLIGQRSTGRAPVVGDVMKLARLRLGIPPSQLAKAAGYHKVMLLRIERDDYPRPSRTMLENIGQVLGVDLYAARLAWCLQRKVKVPRGPFGDVLRAVREQKRLRQYDVAHLCGVVEHTVTSWEVGRNTPSIPLERIAEAVNVDVEQFKAAIAGGAT